MNKFELIVNLSHSIILLLTYIFVNSMIFTIASLNFNFTLVIFFHIIIS